MRVVVGLDENADRADVAARVHDSGADDIRPPLDALPGVLICDFPDGEPVGPLVRRLQELRGVRYAEPDVPQRGM